MLRYILFIIAVLFCPCLYAQPFEQKVLPDIYNNSSWVQNLQPGQAVLLYTLEPATILSNVEVVTYNDLRKSNIDFSKYISSANYGNYYITRSDDTSFFNVISLVDSKYFYVKQTYSSVDKKILQDIQLQMAEKGLGTIEDRARYITLRDSFFIINPVDFRLLLSPWLLAGIGLFLSLPAIYILYRLVRSGIR